MAKLIKNSPRPSVDPAIQEELTKIGGVVEHAGKYFGQPKIKLVWGQEERIFRYGKERLRFVYLGQGQWRYKRWLVSPQLAEKLAEWIKAEAPKHSNPARPVKLSTFFETANSLEFHELPDSEHPTQKVHLAGKRADWLYFFDIEEFLQQGMPFFYVVQYIPPRLYGNAHQWTMQRFGHKFCPETKRVEWLDLLGPFPKDGGYEHELLQLYNTDKDGVESYFAPTWENTVIPVKEMIRARDTQTRAQREAQRQSEKTFAENVAAYEKREDADYQQLEDRLNDTNRPFGGNFVTKPKDTPPLVISE